MSSSWHGANMDGFREVRRRLPVRTESLTQLGRGILQADATVVSGANATLYYANVGTYCGTLADLDEAYTAFVIPIKWRGAFVINGEQVNASSIYMPVDNTLIQVHGDERSTAAVALPREQFITAVAALRGVAPDEVQLDGGALELAPAVLARVRRSLWMTIDNYTNAARRHAVPPETAEMLTCRMMEMVTDLYLHARPAAVPKVRTASRLGRIVRKAEDSFAAAQGGPISLADLCAAAGVSQGTLYHAFTVMCGSSPMAYFKKRRLTDARLALLGGTPERGSVTSAALAAGLTHLGRFSAEYRGLFGESPRATLNPPPG